MVFAAPFCLGSCLINIWPWQRVRHMRVIPCSNTSFKRCHAWPLHKFMLGMHCHIVWTQQSRQESAGQYSARRHGQCTMPLAGVNQRQRGRRSDGFLVHCALIRRISMPFSQFLQVSYIILISQSRLHHPRCSQDFVNYVIRTLGCVGWQHVFSAFMH